MQFSSSKSEYRYRELGNLESRLLLRSTIHKGLCKEELTDTGISVNDDLLGFSHCHAIIAIAW